MSPGDPWMPVLAGNRVGTLFMDCASQHLAFSVPQFLIQASKRRATRASQRAELWGRLGEPAGSEDRSSEKLVSQEPPYLCSSHRLSSEIFTCRFISFLRPSLWQGAQRSRCHTHVHVHPATSHTGCHLCRQGRALAPPQVLLSAPFPRGQPVCPGVSESTKAGPSSMGFGAL